MTRRNPNKRLRRERLKSKPGTCGAAKSAGIHSAPRSQDCRAKSRVVLKGIAPRLQETTVSSPLDLTYVALSPKFPVECVPFPGMRQSSTRPPCHSRASGYCGYRCWLCLVFRLVNMLTNERNHVGGTLDAGESPHETRPPPPRRGLNLPFHNF